MGSALVEFILITELQKYLLCCFEWELEVDEVVEELRESIEDNILRQRLRYFHRLLGRRFFFLAQEAFELA